jgi:hypothetical protein
MNALSHIIVRRRLLPRPVLICPPGDQLTIPTPAMLLGQQGAGDQVYSYEVAYTDGTRALVQPGWVHERRRRHV